MALWKCKVLCGSVCVLYINFNLVIHYLLETVWRSSIIFWKHLLFNNYPVGLGYLVVFTQHLSDPPTPTPPHPTTTTIPSFFVLFVFLTLVSFYWLIYYHEWPVLSHFLMCCTLMSDTKVQGLQPVWVACKVLWLPHAVIYFLLASQLKPQGMLEHMNCVTPSTFLLTWPEILVSRNIHAITDYQSKSEDKSSRWTNKNNFELVSCFPWKCKYPDCCCCVYSHISLGERILGLSVEKSKTSR